MKRFLKHFAVLIVFDFLALGLILLTAFIRGKSPDITRANYSCPEERVYDYADVLTDSEEEKLRELIAESEARVHCDIVIVTLDTPFQDLSGDTSSDELSEGSYYHLAMNFADDFYDNYQYGYNKAWGDGCIFVDNHARENDGWRYYWFSTSGSVEDGYSESDISSLTDSIYNVWDISYYEAYVTYVKSVTRHMSGGGSGTMMRVVSVIGALIAAAIYMGVNRKSKLGDVTTTAATYVGDRRKMKSCNDVLVSQHTTKTKIESSSSSGGGGGGGGGHHYSSGGHSHGGGGGRH